MNNDALGLTEEAAPLRTGIKPKEVNSDRYPLLALSLSCFSGAIPNTTLLYEEVTNYETKHSPSVLFTDEEMEIVKGTGLLYEDGLHHNCVFVDRNGSGKRGT